MSMSMSSYFHYYVITTEITIYYLQEKYIFNIYKFCIGTLLVEQAVALFFLSVKNKNKKK